MIVCRPLLVLAVLVAHLAPLTAAPPNLTYLYPAGARRGMTVEVTAGGTVARWPVGVWIKGQGIDVKPGKDKGKLMVTVAADAEPGTYCLRLHDEEGASVARPFLIGLLPEIAEKEPNNELKQAQKLETTDVVVNGRLDKAGDVDTFAVSLRQGQTLVASVEAHHTLRSPMDAVLQILSEDGFVLAQNDDFHGLDPQLVFTAPRNGTFLVRVFAFPAMPDAGIHFSGGEAYVYRLTLATRGFVDHPFPLSVTAGRPAEVELFGWNLPEPARRLTLPTGGKKDRVIMVHPAIGNHVEVALEPHFTMALHTPTSRTKPQSIPLPATITGRLDKPGAMDFYEFAARKGQPLALRVESQSLDFELEPVLRLTDATGKLLARGEAPKLHADAVVAFTPPTDGNYVLEILDLHGSGGPRHVYRLNAGPAMPDFALTLAADRFTLVPGKPLEIPVTIERRNGFAEAITLSVEGLPATVTVKPVAAKAADKSVTLQLTAQSAGASVPIRVVGKAAGMSALTHVAQAGVAELGSTTEDLWLTVQKAAAK